MAVLVGATLVGFVLGILFLADPGDTERYTELYYPTHKISLTPSSGPESFNYSGAVVTGELLGNTFWVLGPDTEEEVVVFNLEGKETQFRIYETFRLGETYLVFADATENECLFHEYPREVFEFDDVRMRFIIENKMKEDHTYHYRVYLSGNLVDDGEVSIEADGRADVVSSFLVGTTDNDWTRISVTLDTGQNISHAFRTYR
jgi:hypothetical protein